ncbi:MAG: excinuclease ABC subunit UvrA, partial [bacterium]|nr:excinuclease ABC subunit UvrA [bacterium]
MEPISNNNFIQVRGARQHNLKNLNLDIPRNRLVVITGPSGSGKSSLAFDTIYAEGQRRYVESLSTYARQFLDLMEKPDVDSIEGLSPALAIEQRSHTRSPRSTVGTVTEIYDYLRLLFARAGQPHCPQCGKPISRQTVQQMVDEVLSFPEKTRLQILAPLVSQKKGSHADVLDHLRKDGYVRARINGEVCSLDENISLNRAHEHTIEAVIDRLVVNPRIARRLADSIETTLSLTGGTVVLDVLGDRERTFSTQFACPDCGIGCEDLEPRLFSFNSPHGACSACNGLGSRLEVAPDKIVPDPSRSVVEGAIVPWGVPKGKEMAHQLRLLADRHNFDLSAPFSTLSQAAQKTLLWGEKKKQGGFEGVISQLEKRHRETSAEEIRSQLESFMRPHLCSDCKGSRLRPEALAVTLQDQNIAQVTALSITTAHGFFARLVPSAELKEVVRPLLQGIQSRLSFLQDVGVGYLSLNRPADTLSGGEAQRIRLATQIGSRLSGVLYVLDEPSIGLHPRDNHRLIQTLLRLRDLGNSVLVVEHDRDMMLAADYLIDLGPGAGNNGGNVVAQGPPERVMAASESTTGAYLAGRATIPLPPGVRTPQNWLSIHNARGHNLRAIDVSIPLGVFVCITGVSGSGKSTLINQTLYPELAHKLHRASEEPLEHSGIEGIEHIDKVIRIDQAPIGRTPRSNPATYTDLFSTVRELYAQLPEAKVRGYAPGRFSFNLKG